MTGKQQGVQFEICRMEGVHASNRALLGDRVSGELAWTRERRKRDRLRTQHLCSLVEIQQNVIQAMYI